ncbi:MAG: MoaD/ThiS family protein [Oscillospiraceae bacterium]|nr:MoaD/ThiS family protein [Oscillospiraceae bacterium]
MDNPKTAKPVVTVKLYGLLSTYGGPRILTIEAQTLRDICEQLVALGADKAMLNAATVFINNEAVRARPGHRLRSGSEVAFLTASAGG